MVQFFKALQELPLVALQNQKIQTIKTAGFSLLSGLKSKAHSEVSENFKMIDKKLQFENLKLEFLFLKSLFLRFCFILLTTKHNYPIKK
jgi:hypothetical protein